jgi:hypothetical protein
VRVRVKSKGGVKDRVNDNKDNVKYTKTNAMLIPMPTKATTK